MTEFGTGRNLQVAPRIPAGVLQHVTARVAGGREVTLKDLSRTGARLESTRRMLPNSSISLTLTTPGGSFVVPCLIVGSRFVHLASGLGYDVAVSFNQPLQDLAGVRLGAALDPPALSDPPDVRAPNSGW